MAVSPHPRMVIILRLMACALALIAIAVVFATSAMRVGYPFENEWLEGGTLLQVQRILEGDGIYVEPSYAFVAFLYGPIYFYTCAAVSAVVGPGFVPLRMVSLAASVGTVVLIGLFIRRRTGRLDAAIIAAGMYAATYRLSGEWFEIARIDALFLFLFTAAVYLLGTGLSRRSQVLAGVLLAVSCLTKQTVSIMAAPLMLWVFADDWRRGMRVAAAAVATYISGTIVFMILSDGWYWYYTMTLPSRHGLFGRPVSWSNFWYQDIFRPLPIVSVLVAFFIVIRIVRRHSRQAATLELAILTGTLGVSWAGRLNPGGFANVLMPAYFGLAVVVGLGLGWLHDLDLRRRSRLTVAILPAVLVLVMVQLVLLRFDPRDCLPTRADREAGHALVSKLASMPGEVVVSAHPYLLLMAGKETHAHQVAVTELIGGFGGEPDAFGRGVLAECRENIAAKRYSAIILDGTKKPGASSWFVPLEGHYRAAGRVFDDPKVFMAVTGAPRQPTFIMVPEPASTAGGPQPGR